MDNRHTYSKNGGTLEIKPTVPLKLKNHTVLFGIFHMGVLHIIFSSTEFKTG